MNSNYACYWKNAGAVNQLSAIQSAAFSIFVYKGDVYVAGLVNNGSFDRAVYWKNGELVYLSQIKSISNSIFVYNGDVYVAGWGRNRR